MTPKPIVPENDTIKLADLIAGLRADAIKINPEYQRSGRIWPARAKSMLVETVLKRMPIPRVLLHILDYPQPPHQSDIIDGQQRCTVLEEFQRDGFELTQDIDEAGNYGKRFSNLTPAQQATFNEYPVPIDKYTAITDGQIRMVFRRLNYYTAPLNAAEQRHAQFSGELSRFVEEQSRTWSSTFQTLRAFTKRQLTRKADQQLMAELVDAMLNGISTPTAKSLRKVYKAHDRQFSSAPDFMRRMDAARAQLTTWTPLRKNRLVRKHYQLFSFLLALMHAQRELAAVRSDLGSQKPIRSDDSALTALAKLDEAARKKVTRGVFARFWNASQEKTNVRENRLIRCKYYYKALTGR